MMTARKLPSWSDRFVERSCLAFCFFCVFQSKAQTIEVEKHIEGVTESLAPQPAFRIPLAPKIENKEDALKLSNADIEKLCSSQNYASALTEYDHAAGHSGLAESSLDSLIATDSKKRGDYRTIQFPDFSVTDRLYREASLFESLTALNPQDLVKAADRQGGKAFLASMKNVGINEREQAVVVNGQWLQDPINKTNNFEVNL